MESQMREMLNQADSVQTNLEYEFNHRHREVLLRTGTSQNLVPEREYS